MATATMETRAKGGNMPWFSEAKSRVGKLFSEIGEHRVLMIAGSIAYTTALSLAPFVLILLAFASLLGQRFQNQMYQQMTSLMGPQAGDAIKIVVENADNSQSLTTFSGIIGFVVLAISASAIFTQLRSALDIINETPEEKQASGVWGFIREKFLSLGLVFGFIFLAITSLSVTALITGVFEGQEAVVWETVSFLINVVLFSGLFTLMFYFIPTEKAPWKNCLISGITAAAFFLIGKSVIGIYLGNASVGSAYGAAGSLVVFLVWVYYTATTLLISYEFTNTVIIKRSPRRR